MIEIGNKIKIARKRKGISQEELAELTNINLRTIQRIESDESKPRAKTLSLICSALDITTLEVIDSENKVDKKRFVVPIILTSIIFISTFLSWYSFKVGSGNIELLGTIQTTTGWKGYIGVSGVVIYNWLVSICAVSIGGILILTILDIIKRHFKFIIIQLIIIVLYLLFYTNLSINNASVSLKHGLFLVLASTIGLTVLYYKTESKKGNN